MRTATICFVLVAVTFAAICSPAKSRAEDPLKPGDPLPAWNDGPVKTAILDFVECATQDGCKGFIPPEERIAVFDNDGTLWAEQPVYFQIAFAVDRVKALAPKDPRWETKEPFKSLLKGYVRATLAGGEKGIAELMAVTHAGMTTEEFAQVVQNWIATARHPTTGRLYQEMVYQPMLELLAYLRENGFKTYIVSGGGVEFIRAWAAEVYGIPPEQVIGSRGKLKFEERDGNPVLIKLPQVDHIDDGPGKPIGIQQLIGRRPVAAFGNSDGDLPMLQWTAAGQGPNLCLIVHHTDADREWAYDRDSIIGTLDKALDAAELKNWSVVDMKRDWKTVYPAATKLE